MEMSEAVQELRAKVQVGWRVKIVDHDYLNDSRDDVLVTEVRDNGVVLTPKKPWTSQGRKFPFMVLDDWDGEEAEVDGMRIRIFHTPPERTGKPRRLVKTFVFIPPID